MRRISALIIALFLVVSGLFAQSGKDSIELSSFRKGRNLVGLAGSISSSNLSRANGSNDNSQYGSGKYASMQVCKYASMQVCK